jgi:hypothetical protein
MLFWALLASGQINMRKVVGWQTLATNLIDQPIASQPETIASCYWRSRHTKFQPTGGIIMLSSAFPLVHHSSVLQPMGSAKFVAITARPVTGSRASS